MVGADTFKGRFQILSDHWFEDDTQRRDGAIYLSGVSLRKECPYHRVGCINLNNKLGERCSYLPVVFDKQTIEVTEPQEPLELLPTLRDWPL